MHLQYPYDAIRHCVHEYVLFLLLQLGLGQANQQQLAEIWIEA